MTLEKTSSSSDVNGAPPPAAGPGTGPERPAIAGPSRLKPSGVSQQGAVPVHPAAVQGQVDGPSRQSPQLQGRVGPSLPAGVGNPMALALARDVRMINDLINQIELSRPVVGEISEAGRVRQEHGPLPRFAAKLIEQMEVIAVTSNIINDGGAAFGEPVSVKAQVAMLKDLAGTEDSGDEQGNLGRRMQEVEAAGGKNTNENLKKAFAKIDTWTGEVKMLARQRISYISQQLESSPFSLSDHYRTRAGINAAAEKMLDQIISTTHDENKKHILEEGRERFSQRKREQLTYAEARRGEVMRSTVEAGVKRLTGLNRLLHPLQAREERTASELYATQLAYGVTGGAEPPPLDTPQTNEMSVVEDALRILLKKAGLPTASVPHALQQKIQDQIDANPAWNLPVKSGIYLPDPPHTQVGHSQITPAPALLPSYKGRDGVRRGVNSHRSAETTHAVNLAHTQLTTAGGQPLFGGVRHGVLSAFALTPKGVERLSDQELLQAIKPFLRVGNSGADNTRALAEVRSNPGILKKMRAEANKQRALEVVALTVMMNPQLRAAALRGNNPQVDLLSLSLLTPDSFRRGADDNESLMLDDQVEAWKAVTGEKFIEIPDDGGNLVKVKVNVRPVAMNYGVNQGAVKGIGGIRADAVTGWHISDPLNAWGLRQLFGDDPGMWCNAGKPGGILGQRIKRLEDAYQLRLTEAQTAVQAAQAALQEAQARKKGDFDVDWLAAEEAAKGAEKKSRDIFAERNDQRTPLGAALELMRQIGEIYTDGAHRTAGNEPYKMPTRLAVLAELLEVNVAFNCKSGKDRTGELDAEIKHFKLQMRLTGKVPDYKRTRTPEEARQFYQVVTNSGNFEMQSLNTGYRGYKLHGVPELFSQIGAQPGDELARHFHGLSGFTAS